MPAPTKEGLDYFPFDVDLLDNDDLDFLREKYGVVVNDVYIALLTLLYRKKGYYIPYETAAEKNDCIWYVFKRVRGGKYSIKSEAIPRVIEAIVAQGLFSGSCFPKIITSERAQRTYYSATVERKLESFNIIPEYWLLSDMEMRKLSKKHPYYLYLHSENKSDEKPSKSDEEPSKSDEKPLKESKVNNIYNLSNNARTCTHEGDDETNDFETRLNAFCAKWHISIDSYSSFIADIDFDALDKRFAESPDYLADEEKAPWAHALSGVIAKYQSIMSDKYKTKASASRRGGGSGKGIIDGWQALHDKFVSEDDDNDT